MVYGESEIGSISDSYVSRIYAKLVEVHGGIINPLEPEVFSLEDLLECHKYFFLN